VETYELHGVRLDTIISEVDRLWERLQTDEALKQEAADEDVDVSVFAGVYRPQVISIQLKAHSIGGSAASLDIAFATAISGAHIVAYDLWKKVFLPRLQSKFGRDTITPVTRSDSKRRIAKVIKPSDARSDTNGTTGLSKTNTKHRKNSTKKSPTKRR
jgi:hypothetical protein